MIGSETLRGLASIVPTQHNRHNKPVEAKDFSPNGIRFEDPAVLGFILERIALPSGVTDPEAMPAFQERADTILRAAKDCGQHRFRYNPKTLQDCNLNYRRHPVDLLVRNILPGSDGVFTVHIKSEQRPDLEEQIRTLLNE